MCGAPGDEEAELLDNYWVITSWAAMSKGPQFLHLQNGTIGVNRGPLHLPSPGLLGNVVGQRGVPGTPPQRRGHVWLTEWYGQQREKEMGPQEKAK